MEWISTKDKLPEDQQYVLVAVMEGYPPSFYPHVFMYEEYTRSVGFFWAENNRRFREYEVEWWMPLPEPPKGEEE